MKVGELISKLQEFNGEQYVAVLLHGSNHPRGVQIVIQGVKEYPGWNGSKLVGLFAHECNGELSNCGEYQPKKEEA